MENIEIVYALHKLPVLNYWVAARMRYWLQTLISRLIVNRNQLFCPYFGLIDYIELSFWKTLKSPIFLEKILSRESFVNMLLVSFYNL